MSSLHEVLHRVEGSVAGGELPVVVFDLDSTLFDTSGRNLKILKDFAQESGDEILSAHIADVTHDELGWSVGGPLKRRGVDDEALHRELLSFWKDRFFTDDYVVHDLAAPGAVEFTRAVHERGALVYYLTGRHVRGMGVGTVQSLTQHGFPLWRGRTTLHLKPSFDMPDRAYKAAAIADIRSSGGPIVATFDNEPENCNVLRAAFPDGLHFRYGSVHSPDPEPLHASIHHLNDFLVDP